MIKIDEILLWRKYYFSLPVKPLFNHLLKREVPLIPNEKDFVWHLYNHLDIANDRNSWALTEYLGIKFVSYMKSPRERLRTPKKRLAGSKKQLHTYEYSIIVYPNNEVIARVYEPHMIDNLKMFFRYSHHASLGDYLLFEIRRETNLKSNNFLCNLADSIHFDNWMMNKALRGELKNVV